MKIQAILEKVTDEFGSTYTQFREFQQNPEYRAYWDKCIESVTDRDIFMSIIFCNDVFGIPPVKTFLTVYLDNFISITGNEQARLDSFLKRSIGAL